jgi:hypothetical protein
MRDKTHCRARRLISGRIDLIFGALFHSCLSLALLP